MQSARWKREANSLIFAHVAGHRFAGDTLVFGVDCFCVELGKLLLPNIQPVNCDVANRPLYSERNASTTAVDTDFSFRGEVTMFRIFIFVALLT